MNHQQFFSISLHDKCKCRSVYLYLLSFLLASKLEIHYKPQKFNFEHKVFKECFMSANVTGNPINRGTQTVLRCLCVLTRHLIKRVVVFLTASPSFRKVGHIVSINPASCHPSTAKLNQCLKPETRLQLQQQK